MAKFSIAKTMKEAPVRAIIYGTGGVGKSTLAAAAPGTVFVAAEDGLKNIDARAVEPFPATWEEALEAVRELATADIGGIAIDSLDWLEPLCWDYVVRKADPKKKIQQIEDFGYGKGYLAALDEWRVLLHELSVAHRAGKHVILIAHATRKSFKNPAGDDYEHWTPKLNDKATGLLVEWVDLVGFAEVEANTFETSKGSERFKALSTGKRVLRVQPNPAYLAKTRYAMPKAIPLNWQSFDEAIRSGGPAAVARLKAELEAKLAELGDDMTAAGARTFLRTRGETAATLAEAIATVDAYLAEKANERKAG